MRKIIAIVLAVMMLASMATVASASNTTTLTTTVPAASYTLNIPADQKIPFGAINHKIGAITVTEASGFAVGKDLQVSVEMTPFTCDGISTTIPYTLTIKDDRYTHGALNLNSGDSIVFKGKDDGTVAEKVDLGMHQVSGNVADTLQMEGDECVFVANSEDWGKALAGEYTSTLTFTCEVVVE